MKSIDKLFVLPEIQKKDFGLADAQRDGFIKYVEKFKEINSNNLVNQMKYGKNSFGELGDDVSKFSDDLEKVDLKKDIAYNRIKEAKKLEKEAPKYLEAFQELAKKYNSQVSKQKNNLLLAVKDFESLKNEYGAIQEELSEIDPNLSFKEKAKNLWYSVFDKEKVKKKPQDSFLEKSKSRLLDESKYLNEEINEQKKVVGVEKNVLKDFERNKKTVYKNLDFINYSVDTLKETKDFYETYLSINSA